jgi:GntR family transcriptional repressor for pyruvate dehydrogenase complex
MSRALNVLEESDSPFEILQVRKAMEIGIVHLAIKKASEEDIQMIWAAWKVKQEKGKSKKYREFISYGREFHLAIAKATKSKAIEAVTDELLKLTGSRLWLSMREGYFNEDPERIEPILELHENIVRAIEQRDVKWAIRLIEEHYDLNLKQQYDVTDGANDT